MPVFRQHIAFDLARRARAFLRLDLGLVRGEAPPDLEQLLKQRSRELEKARGRIEEQARRIERLRVRLADRELPAGAGNGRAGDRIVEDFHKLYYYSSATGGTWLDTYWMGVPIWKCPLDLWVYAEIISERRPDLIVETGTALGGSALFMAGVCDLVGNGRVVTIDIEAKDRPRHGRIEYLQGSSTAEDIVEQALRGLREDAEVMVILDSDHSRDHVLDELRIYSPFVKKGGYLIVEDTNINGHPVMPGLGPGPMEAVEDFLKENDGFVVDASKEKFYMTYNPRGYLKKV